MSVSPVYVYLCDVILFVGYNIFWWLGWLCVRHWIVGHFFMYFSRLGFNTRV